MFLSTIKRDLSCRRGDPAAETSLVTAATPVLRWSALVFRHKEADANDPTGAGVLAGLA